MFQILIFPSYSKLTTRFTWRVRYENILITAHKIKFYSMNWKEKEMYIFLPSFFYYRGIPKWRCIRFFMGYMKFVASHISMKFYRLLTSNTPKVIGVLLSDLIINVEFYAEFFKKSLSQSSLCKNIFSISKKKKFLRGNWDNILEKAGTLCKSTIQEI